MYRTEIKLIVLSEEEVPFAASLDDILREGDTGCYVIHEVRTPAARLTDAQMKTALIRAGSDTSFFYPEEE